MSDTSWKPSPQKWLIRVARFRGEVREFRRYVRPTREEALALALDLEKTGQWDSLWIEQHDVLLRTPKGKAKPVDSPRANRNRRRKAARLSAAARTVEMFK